MSLWDNFITIERSRMDLHDIKPSDLKPSHPRILITLEGGLIQDVSSSHPDIEVIVLDLDTDSNDPDEMQHSPIDGSDCIITRITPTLNPKLIDRFEGL